VAGVVLMKKNSFVNSIMREWEEIAFEDDMRYVKDVPPSKRHLEDPRFIDHRHDQSIFSLLRKARGAGVVIDDETYYTNWNSAEAMKMPIRAMRDSRG
jgi:hypothetical protein